MAGPTNELNGDERDRLEDPSGEAAGKAPRRAAGKATRAERGAPGGAVDAAVRADGNGGASAGRGMRAGDWEMTPQLSSAMGLGADEAADPNAPTGTHEKTPFGDYWVIPDDTSPDVHFHDANGEIVKESEFRTAQAVWAKISDGSGKLQILETNLAGKATAGFKAMVLTKISTLMSKAKGRELIIGLASGGYDVKIRPSTGKINGGAQARRDNADSLEKSDGTANKGGGTTVELDPTCSDTDNKVHDKDGKEISDPVFIILGHELIHARHNQEGRNRRNLAAKSNKYSNREEEETIATGAGINENVLRDEHRLTARDGHSGHDTRF